MKKKLLFLIIPFFTIGSFGQVHYEGKIVSPLDKTANDISVSYRIDNSIDGKNTMGVNQLYDIVFTNKGSTTVTLSLFAFSTDTRWNSPQDLLTSYDEIPPGGESTLGMGYTHSGPIRFFYRAVTISKELYEKKVASNVNLICTLKNLGLNNQKEVCNAAGSPSSCKIASTNSTCSGTIEDITETNQSNTTPEPEISTTNSHTASQNAGTVNSKQTPAGNTDPTSTVTETISSIANLIAEKSAAKEYWRQKNAEDEAKYNAFYSDAINSDMRRFKDAEENKDSIAMLNDMIAIGKDYEALKNYDGLYYWHAKAAAYGFIDAMRIILDDLASLPANSEVNDSLLYAWANKAYKWDSQPEHKQEYQFDPAYYYWKLGYFYYRRKGIHNKQLSGAYYQQYLSVIGAAKDNLKSNYGVYKHLGLIYKELADAPGSPKEPLTLSLDYLNKAIAGLNLKLKDPTNTSYDRSDFKSQIKDIEGAIKEVQHRLQ